MTFRGRRILGPLFRTVSRNRNNGTLRARLAGVTFAASAQQPLTAGIGVTLANVTPFLRAALAADTSPRFATTLRNVTTSLQAVQTAPIACSFALGGVSASLAAQIFNPLRLTTTLANVSVQAVAGQFTACSLTPTLEGVTAALGAATSANAGMATTLAGVTTVLRAQHTLQVSAAAISLTTVTTNLRATASSPAGQLGDAALRRALPGVVMFEDFSTYGSVHDYMAQYVGIWQTDHLKPDDQKRWQWVDPFSHPDRTKLLPWHKGGLKIIVNGPDGESTALWARRLNDSWTRHLDGYGPPTYNGQPVTLPIGPGGAAVPIVNEYWTYFSIRTSTDDYLKFWRVSSGGETKFAIMDKYYRQSTMQEWVINNDQWRNYINAYWNRDHIVNLHDVAAVPGFATNFRQEPGIDHRFGTTHPLGLDPNALNPDGPWEFSPLNTANPSPRPWLYEDSSGESALRKRIRYGGLYHLLRPNGAGPAGSDTGYSGGFMLSRDAGDRHIGIMVRTQINEWSPLTSDGTSQIEVWVHPEGGDFIWLGGYDRAGLARHTGSENPGAISTAYGTGDITVDPAAESDGSHHPNALTLQLYDSGRLSIANGGGQLNPAYPADTPYEAIYAEAANREGREGLPAPGWYWTGPPVSHYARPDFLPAALTMRRLTTAANARPRMIDANPSDWGGTSSISIGSGATSLPSIFGWSCLAWDRKKHRIYNHRSGTGHAIGWNNGTFVYEANGKTQPRGWYCDDITAAARVSADVAAAGGYASADSLGGQHSDGRPLGTHIYNAQVLSLRGERIFSAGGAPEPAGSANNHLWQYVLGSNTPGSASASGYTRVTMPGPGFAYQGAGLILDEKWNHLLLLMPDNGGQYVVYDPDTLQPRGTVHSATMGRNGGNGMALVYDYTRNRALQLGANGGGTSPDPIVRRMLTYNGVTGLLTSIPLVIAGDNDLMNISMPAATYHQGTDCFYVMDLSSGSTSTNTDAGRWLWRIPAGGVATYVAGVATSITFTATRFDVLNNIVDASHTGSQSTEASRGSHRHIGEFEYWPNHIALMDKAGLAPVLLGVP